MTNNDTHETRQARIDEALGHVGNLITHSQDVVELRSLASSLGRLRDLAHKQRDQVVAAQKPTAPPPRWLD